MSDPQLLREIDQLKRQFKALQSREKTIYAAGTFTPTFIGSTSGAATVYSTQDGRYTRIGDMCYVWIAMTWTASTAVGNGRVASMPFAIASGASAYLPVFSANYAYTNAGIAAFISAGNTYLDLFDQVAGAFTPLAVDAAASLIIAGAYKV